MSLRLGLWAALGLAAGLPGLIPAESAPPSPPASAPSSAEQRSAPERGQSAPAGDAQLYASAAGPAWRFVEAHYQPATGFVSAVGGYQYATIWDIASGLAALYSAHELGLMETDQYHRRVGRALETLGKVSLFDGVAFTKVYSTVNGAMAGRSGDRPSKRGNGWSTTDIGRLLIWLKIIAARHPQYQEDAAAIVGRLDGARLVKDGYLWGASVDSKGGLREYQEGRVGYEQYAARGFAAWGFPVSKALDLEENGIPITVMGKSLLADVRAQDRLTSEPLVLMGLELGWTPGVERLATQLLAAQEERYRRTGRVTIVSEDAISRPPYFFYYYCAYADDKEFSPDVQDLRAVVDGPRWVSTKAAFAWHALRPNDYTRRAVEAVGAARGAAGWGSGVYEVSGRSTGTANVNTQAVILTSALVKRRGQPLLPGS